MNSRKNQIRNAETATCEWIWSTTFATWLVNDDDRAFWISGKPGSGKSTLVKYLSGAPRVKENHLQGRRPRIVIDFYFDFRQGQRTGNTEEGLLRTLLREIAAHLPTIGRKFDGRSLDGNEMSIDEMLHLLYGTLADAQQPFLAFIDGLDEYDGEMDILMNLLKSLNRLNNLKVCLASRPEPLIRAALESCPRISMSDHNTAGIQHYIRTRVAEFQPYLKVVDIPEIQDIMLDRAEGVFLWVHLALANIAWACVNGASVDEVKDKLDALPRKVEELYERIIARIPDERKSEAAVLYTMASTADYGPHVSTELLRQVMDFLALEICPKALPTNIATTEHFQLRFHATMGGLLELVPAPCESESHLNMRHECLTVRLMHETVRSYSEKSGWVARYLPAKFRAAFPDRIWARLCFKFLVVLDRRIETWNAKMLDVPAKTTGLGDSPGHVLLGGKMFKQVEAAMSPMTDFCTQTFQLPYSLDQCSMNESLLEWPWLLRHGIQKIALYAQSYGAVENENFQFEMEAALRTGLAGTHLLLVGNHSRDPVPGNEALIPGVRDLTLTASHACFEYLTTKLSRITALSDTHRNHLVAAMVRAGIQQPCLNYAAKPDWDHLRSIVNTIWMLNRHVNSFHVWIYIRLGYKEMPQFLLQQLLKGTDRMWGMLHGPARQNLRIRPPLFVWACNYTDTGMSAEDLKPESQLQVLLTLGFGINDRDSAGYNIVHYLITKHIVNHTYLEDSNDAQCYPDDDLVEALEKLYLVHRAGADFKVQIEHRTPLQALRHGLDRIRDTPPDQRNFEDVQEGRFAHLEYVLEHEEQTGHLPTPLMGADWRAKPKQALQHRCDRCEGTENADTQVVMHDIKLQASREAPKPPGPPGRQGQDAETGPLLNSTNRTQSRHVSPSIKPSRNPKPSTLVSADNGNNSTLSPSRTPRPSRSPRSSRGSNTYTSGNADNTSSTTLSPSRTPRPSRSPQPSRSPGYLEPTASSRRRELVIQQETRSKKATKPPRSQ